MAVDAENWRDRCHGNLSEAFRWFKAIPTSAYNPANNSYTRGGTVGSKDGRRYVEQSATEGFAGLIGATEETMQDAEFGEIEIGSTTITVMPDEAPLSRLDKIIMSAQKLTTRDTIVRGSGATDALPHAPVVSITAVIQDTTTYAVTTNYTLVGDTINWVSGGPATGSNYSVEYLYNPTYFYLGNDQQTPQVDSYGTMMPITGALVLTERFA